LFTVLYHSLDMSHQISVERLRVDQIHNNVATVHKYRESKSGRERGEGEARGVTIMILQCRCGSFTRSRNMQIFSLPLLIPGRRSSLISIVCNQDIIGSKIREQK
jgi:hypothetical protein